MEIKTLEHYAVARLQELEDTVDSLKDTVKSLTEENNKLNQIIQRIKSDLRVNVSCDNVNHYISLDNKYENYEPTEYTWYINTLGLSVDEEDSIDG